jgi:hypothetical protein
LAWIKFDKDLIDDPRVLQAAEILAERYTLSVERVSGPGFATGSDVGEQEAVTLMRNAVTGALVTLWVYADTHIRNGDELPISMSAVDRMVGIEGFCEIVGEDWVRSDNYGTTVILPGYCEKNGLISKDKRKSSNADRQRRFRERKRLESNAHSNAVSNAVTSNAVTLLDQDLDQDQKKVRELVAPLPDWLPQDPWKAWLEVRRRNKAPNTPRALTLAIKELEKLRADGQDPVAVLEQSTLRGWRGLFPIAGSGSRPEPVRVDL